MLEIHLKNNEVIYIKNFSKVKCYFDNTLTNVEKTDIAELTLHDEDNTYTFCGDTTVVLSGKEISYLVIE
ncbi:MAG: hypothetical protein E6446_00045 [Gemella haemolysans]|nr:hypothetical protein [Gemella haemolysans]